MACAGRNGIDYNVLVNEASSSLIPAQSESEDGPSGYPCPRSVVPSGVLLNFCGVS